MSCLFRYYKGIMFCVIFLLGANLSSHAFQLPILPISIDSSFYHDSLGNSFYEFSGKVSVYMDEDGLTSIDDILRDNFREKFTLVTSFPVQRPLKGAVWLNLLIENTSSHPVTLVVKNNNDEITLFEVDENKKVSQRKGGLMVPLSKLDSSIYEAFLPGEYISPIQLSPGQKKEIFIKYSSFKISTNGIHPLFASESYLLKEYAPKIVNTQRGYALFIGILLVLGLFNFLIYIVNRDKGYLFYSLFILSIIVYALGLSGYTVPEHPDWLILFMSSASYGTIIFFVRFIVELIHRNDDLPKLRKRYLGVAKVGFWMWLVSFIGLIFSARDLQVVMINNLFFLPLLLSNLGFTAYATFKYVTHPSTLIKYFGFSMLFLICASALITSLLILHHLGVISQTFEIAYIMIVFYALLIIQLLTFSFFLSYRNKLIENKKDYLEELDSLKSLFFANISHEFRTPLTLILGPTTQLLSVPEFPSKWQGQLEMIRRNGKRLLRLINQILDLSKLDADGMALNLQQNDIVSFIKNLIREFEPIAIEKNISLTLEPKIDTLSIFFDSEKVEKIIYNLISNALKYTSSPGKIVVDIRHSDDKKQILIQVTDSGIGISQEHIPYIFDRFYQTPQDNYTVNQASTGIGLALTKELVELHGGKIEVKSAIGEGTSFCIYLPSLVKNADVTEYVNKLDRSKDVELFSSIERTDYIDDSQHPTLEDRKSNTQPLILLIEDNEDIRSYIRSSLKDMYTLIEASNGQEGLTMAKQSIPDLIITDVMMPLKDGFELSRALKGNDKTSHIPIIILTAKSSPDSKREGLETEVDEYLSKPFEMWELKSRIKNLLNNRIRWQKKFSTQILWNKVNEPNLHSQEEVFINRAVEIIESQLSNESFTVEQFADALNLDRTQLFRKIKALTNHSPSRFIRSVRLRHARQLIESNVGTISEIAYSVGFSSTAYFNKVFKEEFGKVPSKFKPQS